MSMLNDYNCIKPFKKRKLDYATAYALWYERLADKVLNLFTWNGLPFPQRELEIRLQLYGKGYAGVLHSEKLNRMIVATGSATGVTEYKDKWINFQWNNPVDFGIGTIGENVALIFNNSLHQTTRRLVMRYAHLLAHAELSLQTILINARATGIVAAKDNKQKEDIETFYSALEDGRTLAIVDDNTLSSVLSSQGLRSVSTSYPSSMSIIDFWQIRQNLYKEFLAEIGISKAGNKRERLITDEVEQDKPLYQYSLDDMLRCREDGADEINRLFGAAYGLDVSVKINDAVFLNDESEVADNGDNDT